MKLNYSKNPPLLYYIHWAGYKGTDKEFSWLSTSELDHANDLVYDFHMKYPLKPDPIKYSS